MEINHYLSFRMSFEKSECFFFKGIYLYENFPMVDMADLVLYLRLIFVKFLTLNWYQREFILVVSVVVVLKNHMVTQMYPGFETFCENSNLFEVCQYLLNKRMRLSIMRLQVEC